jgi:CubicO group peptidase (beta-lactamase class C family)
MTRSEIRRARDTLVICDGRSDELTYMIADRRIAAWLTCALVVLTTGCRADTGTRPAPATEPVGRVDASSSTPREPFDPTVPPSTEPVIATRPTIRAQVDVPDGVAVRAVLEQWAAEVHAFGASVGVRVPGHDDVIVAVGVDARNPDTPMPTGGRFQIASVTKTFVSALVLMLVEDGKLRLDQTIERWFPDIKDADRITISMLLSHHSGLADFGRDRPDDYRAAMLADLSREYTAREAIAQSTALTGPFAPGDGYSYSNTNFQILGEIAAFATGTSIAELIDFRLTGPLHLDATSLADDPSSTPTNSMAGSPSIRQSVISKTPPSTRPSPETSTSSTSHAMPSSPRSARLEQCARQSSTCSHGAVPSTAAIC